MATAEVINISQPIVSAPPESAIIYTHDLWKTYDMSVASAQAFGLRTSRIVNSSPDSIRFLSSSALILRSSGIRLPLPTKDASEGLGVGSP